MFPPQRYGGHACRALRVPCKPLVPPAPLSSSEARQERCPQRGRVRVKMGAAFSLPSLSACTRREHQGPALSSPCLAQKMLGEEGLALPANPDLSAPRVSSVRAVKGRVWLASPSSPLYPLARQGSCPLPQFLHPWAPGPSLGAQVVLILGLGFNLVGEKFMGLVSW